MVETIVPHEYYLLLDTAQQRGAHALESEGFDPQLLPSWHQYTFVGNRDPYSGGAVFNGSWKDPHSQSRSSIVLSMEAGILWEYDLLRSHPRVPGRWAEQLSIWGHSAQELKAEVSLLVSLED